MKYSEALKYLLSLNSVPHKKYLKNKKNAGIYLKRIGYLLKLLGHPERQIPHYIHVTGTSGKGSTAIMLENILRAAGQKTGLTTSPHPSAITERWTIDGREITKREFATLTETIRPKIEMCAKHSPYGFPSFFEIITVMGLMLFAQKKIDWAIMEVGLGGRYDSTNIIPKKDIAIITNIGPDHLKIIGPTLAHVAREKAGIIKKGCEVLTMEKKSELLKIIKKECQKYSINLRAIKNPVFAINRADLSGTKFVYKGEKYSLPVLGAHQIGNAILAIETAHLLKISNSATKSGLSKIQLPSRLEIISKKPLIILDGAHNPDKMAATIKTIISLINQQKKLKTKINLVLGFSADKDITTMLKQLAVLKPQSIICTRFTSNPMRQSADPKMLAVNIKKLMPATDIRVVFDPRSAFQKAKKMLKNNGLLLVTGSFFLSGQLREENGNN